MKIIEIFFFIFYYALNSTLCIAVLPHLSLAFGHRYCALPSYLGDTQMKPGRAEIRSGLHQTEIIFHRIIKQLIIFSGKVFLIRLDNEISKRYILKIETVKKMKNGRFSKIMKFI
ncbi:hypothetical protein PUN28_011285 [Cardiocondyla obscurior]|uniref:Secreted protein n=1 Tax=Cardiocondyla obscurior TaxID=286306 RepID=A0AAW2FFK1_9HYME